MELGALGDGERAAKSFVGTCWGACRGAAASIGSSAAVALACLVSRSSMACASWSTVRSIRANSA
ncbi:hypothetical protein [Streptomyces pseudovenezuelae]|uniref:hypothetical protein n=1 Tax=Streptomyces pseudovenezuelae TaxID=67350 RepID=UPI002E8185D7|nr:hypothetical protein [Streptomyces pseudovenezuelae]WUA87575.1 hypothetical protein OHO81_09890 [Streptomyces pseudovenezuelae]